MINIIVNTINSQNAVSSSTSAFSDIWGWWRADTKTGIAGSYVLTDKSANGRNMTQTGAGAATFGIAANGQAKIAGTATTYFNNPSTIDSWPITVITISKRASNATFGFFGHQGGFPQSTLWVGYQATQFGAYVSSGNLSTNTSTSDQCTIARLGWGSRINIIDGLIQAEQTLSNAVRPAAAAVSIGTQFRGLVGDWYETLVWNRQLSLSEIDEVHAYINTRYSMSISLFSSLTKVKTIKIDGQSNADGRGDRGTADVNIPVEYQGAQAGVFLLNPTVSTSIITKNITTEAGVYFGFDLTIGKDYKTRTGNDIYMVKYAVGGTSMSSPGTGNGYWEAMDNSTAQNSSLKLYNKSIGNWWSFLYQLQQQGKTPELLSEYFYQGETDATNQSWSIVWSSKAVVMLPEMYKELGVTPVKTYIIKLHSGIAAATYDYISNVQAQEAIAASTLGATLYSVDNKTLRGDLLHLDAASQVSFGQDLSLLL